MDYQSRKQQALEACDKVINGVEDDTISVSSAMLQCLKIARLVNDEKGQQWLKYEYGGYPRNNDGHIDNSAWKVAANHGRKYVEKEKAYVFTDLAAELENSIESIKKAINNYSLQGFSVSGEYAAVATNNMTHSVTTNTSVLLNQIKLQEKRLSILKSQYYDYVIKWKIELIFGNAAKRIFENYQETTDLYFSMLPDTTVQKLRAIEDLFEDDNPERYSQILTSCRRLWQETATVLFYEVLPEFKGKTYKTKSGKVIDISGDHTNNKLSAIIETLQSKTAKNTLVGSEAIYLIDWMEQISNSQSAGVHSEVTKEQAMQSVIHSYIVLGDILNLKHSIDNRE